MWRRRLSLHVLLVEDDDEMRGMLAFVLGKHGYFVTGARDGRQALECLDDIVLKGGSAGCLSSSSPTSACPDSTA